MTPKDIKIGDTIGEWTVIEFTTTRKWTCKCSCGTSKLVDKYSLANGVSTNCGHKRKEPKEIKIGDMFGYWQVLKYSGNKNYLCKCTACNKTIRNVLIGLGATAIAVAGGILGHHAIQVNKLNKALKAIDTKFAKLEQNLPEVQSKFQEIFTK